MNAESAALQALERRVREQIGVQVEAIATNFGAYLASIVRSTDTTATELLSREDVNAALTAVLAGAETKIEEVVSGAYTASANLGKVVAGREFKPIGHDVPDELPYLGGYLDSVIQDVKAAFGNVTMDIHNGVRDAHDGVTGDDPAPYRVLTTNAALKKAVRGLSVRVTAAGTAALHRGFSDAQLALFGDYAHRNPQIPLRKKWTVTNSDPCEYCAALDGTIIPVSDQFDRAAGTPEGHSTLPVYRDLLAPPRHPACRCRLVLVTD